MYKLLGFRVMVAPIDDCDNPDLNEKSRMEKMEHALETLRQAIRPLIRSGHQILAYGPMPEIESQEKELS